MYGLREHDPPRGDHEATPNLHVLWERDSRSMQRETGKSNGHRQGGGRELVR